MIRQFSLIRLFFPLIIAVSVPLTVYMVSQQTSLTQFAAEEAVLYMVSDQPAVISGQTLTYTLSVDTHKVPVKSVLLSLSYPADKVDIESIETASSPFDLPLEEIKGSGYLRFGREASTPVFGEQHIATVRVKAKGNFSATEIAPAVGTQILSLENKNIYTDALSRTRTIQEAKSTNPLSSFFEALTNIFTR